MLTGSIIGDIKWQFRYGNMVVKLIIVNVAVFIVTSLALLGFFIAYQNLDLANLHLQSYLKFFEAPASIATALYQPWSVFTYMFIHQGLGHIFFNMLWLYWFGEIFVLYLGDKKVLPVYIIGGITGAVTYWLLAWLRPAIVGPYMAGASASIYAIVFAAAALNPEHEISIIFIGPVKIKYVAVFSLLLDIINIPYGNAGGLIAHAGGAVSGFLYVASLRSGFDPVGGFLNLFKRKSPVKVSYKNTDARVDNTKSRSDSEQQKVDEILDKIARSGYDSLSKEERDFLFNYSKK